MSKTRPAHPAIQIDAKGAAVVRGRRCTHCDARLTHPSLACSSCGARGPFETYDVATRGSLRAYSIVHRSFPGVKTPFVSAVVDLADGTVLKGNLRGVAPSPEAVVLGMPVKLVLDDAGSTDSEGARFVAYFFEAA